MQSDQVAVPARTRRVRVWDVPVRLFHWTLAALVVASYVTAKLGGNWMEWHMRSGYTILVLVLFRILWGFAGSQTARFTDFLAGPRSVLSYAKNLLGAGHAVHCGHNPLGGWMVLLLLSLLLIQATTGLFADDDIATQGPLAAHVSGQVVTWATRIHHFSVNVLLACVALHVIAVIGYWWLKRDNLIVPMLTGDKLVDAEQLAEAPHMASGRLALLLFGVCAGAVAAVVMLA